MSTTEHRGSSDGAATPGLRDVVRRPMLFREVNERIARLGGVQGFSGPWLLLCECATSGCTEQVTIAPSAYERVRRFPTRFLVTPGHVACDGDHVVRETSRYVVVEKHGRAAREAIRLDPRRVDGASR